MQINNIKNTNTTFKKGLPSWYPEYVRKINPTEIEQKLAQKGLLADTKGIPAVAASVNEVVGIMEKYKLHLPKKFEFRPLEEGVLGCFQPIYDKVCINARYSNFYDIEKQNLLEENQREYHPVTQHFLQTYLHEFIHSAHYDNIKKHNNDCDYAFYKMWEMKPYDIIVKYLTLYAARFLKQANNLERELCSDKNGRYAQEDLLEYIAEMVSRRIAENLDNNLNTKSDCYINYPSTPLNWDLEREFIKIVSFANEQYYAQSFWGRIGEDISGLFEKMKKIIQLCQKDINYVNGDIWNGNLQRLNKRRL